MKYVSIDIETTGLDPENHQILSFGAIIEDTDKPELGFEEVPKFYKVFLNELKSGADPYALSMNKEALMEISERGGNSIYFEYFTHEFKDFLEDKGFDLSKPLNLAGKNIATFDLKFLERNWWNLDQHGHPMFEYYSRILDPAILCVDWGKDDKLPSLHQCKERCGIKGEVSHHALSDAWDVIQILRKHINNKT